MKGPRILDGSPRRPCSRIISIRIPYRVADNLEATAVARGMSGASVVRALLVEKLHCDPTDAQPAPIFRKPRRKPHADILAVAQLRESLGEAVGTLRQVAGLDRSRDGSRLSELDTAIDGLLAEVRRFDDLKVMLEGFDA